MRQSATSNDLPGTNTLDRERLTPCSPQRSDGCFEAGPGVSGTRLSGGIRNERNRHVQPGLRRGPFRLPRPGRRLLEPRRAAALRARPAAPRGAHRRARTARRRHRRPHRPQPEGQVRRPRRQHRSDRLVGQQRPPCRSSISTRCSPISSPTPRARRCSPRISTAAPTRPSASRRASSPNTPGTRCSSATF